MKKNLVLMAMAGVALASCVNDVAEVAQNQEQKVKVGFGAPVLYNNTESRANVPGEIGNVTTGTNAYTYPSQEDFIVYAVQHDGPFVTWEGLSEFGFSGEAITYNPSFKSWVPWDESANGGKGDYYYWPNGYLSFAATSPADLEQGSGWSEETQRTYGKNGLNITNFTVLDDLERQYDLLFSERTVGCTSSSMQSAEPNKYNGVPIKFHHALTSIHFAIQNTAANTSVELKKLTISGVENKGTFSENIKDEDAEYAIAEDVVEPAWTIDYTDGQTVSYVVFDSTKKVQKDGGMKEQGTLEFPQQERHISVYAGEKGMKAYSILPLPQNLTNVVLTVEYKVNGAAVGDAVIELDGYGDLTEWLMGYRYTYHLVYSADSHLDDIIQFAPETEAWKDGGTIVINL